MTLRLTLSRLVLPLLLLAACLVGCPKTAPVPPNPTPAATLTPAAQPPVEPPAPIELPAPVELPASVELPAPVAVAEGRFPVADLDAAIASYIERVEKAADELAATQDFAADSEAFVRDASALALLARGAATMDGSRYQESAAPLVAAASVALSVTDAASAATAAVAIKTASTTKGDAATSATGQVVPLAPVMKAIPNISSAVNRIANSESKLKRAGTRATEGIAAMAVIVEQSRPNVGETVKPDAESEWVAACDAFRDQAIAASGSAHAFLIGQGDFATFETAFTAMNESCNTCHATFHPTATSVAAE